MTTETGQGAAFTVGVQAAAPRFYQWRRNLAPIPGATNATLTLTNVQPADVGTFSVTVSNRHGSATSSNAYLVVLPVGGIQHCNFFQRFDALVLSYMRPSCLNSAWTCFRPSKGSDLEALKINRFFCRVISP